MNILMRSWISEPPGDDDAPHTEDCGSTQLRPTPSQERVPVDFSRASDGGGRAVEGVWRSCMLIEAEMLLHPAHVGLSSLSMTDTSLPASAFSLLVITDRRHRSIEPLFPPNPSDPSHRMPRRRLRRLSRTPEEAFANRQKVGQRND